MNRIAFLENSLLHDLKPEPFFTQAKNILAGLPQLSHGILEYRLSPADPRMDLMLQARANTQELGSLSPEGSLPGASQSQAHLMANQLIQSIADTWSDKKQYLHGLLSNLYLVYDLLPDTAHIPVPWMYCSFHPISFLDPVRFSFFSKTIDLLSLSYRPAVMDNLKLCFQQLDAPAWIFGFGGMFTREGNTLRIGIAGFSRLEEIVVFLEKINWPGEPDSLLKQSAWLTEQVSSLVLALDISDTFQPEIGIECEFLRAENHQQAKPVFEALVSRGLCAGARARAMLAWIGTEQVPHQAMVVERWINHVKIAYSPTAAIKTKGYLYYQFRPEAQQD